MSDDRRYAVEEQSLDQVVSWRVVDVIADVVIETDLTYSQAMRLAEDEEQRLEDDLKARES
jgi:hypothetical protein